MVKKILNFIFYPDNLIRIVYFIIASAFTIFYFYCENEVIRNCAIILWFFVALLFLIFCTMSITDYSYQEDKE